MITSYSSGKKVCNKIYYPLQRVVYNLVSVYARGKKVYTIATEWIFFCRFLLEGYLIISVPFW